MSQVTVTQMSHDHVSQWNKIESLKRDNIIIIYLTHVNLKNNIWLFRVG